MHSSRIKIKDDKDSEVKAEDELPSLSAKRNESPKFLRYKLSEKPGK